MGIQKVCAISEPLVKVLHLVDGDRPTMDYLYEDKEAIHWYCEDKGEEGFTRRAQTLLPMMVNSDSS
jgi:hypothetical protein